MLERSMWGRSQRLSYRYITKLAVDLDHLSITFKTPRAYQVHSIPRSGYNIRGLVRRLAEQGVTAAQDFKWEVSRSSER